MKSNELSTEIITHKLKIKWEWVKYISKKFAQWIFWQLQDQTKNTVQIINPDTLTFITKYKSEVDLIKLDSESNELEDQLYLAWLKESQKERVRDIRDNRKKNREPRTPWTLKIIITKVKNWEA